MADREEFVDRYVRAILDIAQDVKVMISILDDPDVSEEGRGLAAGAMLSLIETGDLIPDTWGPVGLLDDAIFLRLAAEQALPVGSEAYQRAADRHPEFFADLDGDLASARRFLGGCFALFEQRLGVLARLEHKGKRAGDAVSSDAMREWLLEEVGAAMVDLDLEETQLVTAMRRIDSVLAHLRRRLTHR